MSRTAMLLQQAVAPVSKVMARPEVTWAHIRRTIDKVAAEKGEWGGAPIPVNHARLVMEPRYPFPGLNGMKLGGEKKRIEGRISEEWAEINSWFDYRRNGTIHVMQKDGRSRVGFISHGAGQRLAFWIDTLGVAASPAWEIETEARALEKLRSLVSTHAYRCYMLCGCFLETSKRSGVTYLFRKLRPTIALRPVDGTMDVIAVLCLHPLGFYEGTWAGVRCPTDDVVAHLMLMRGDEHWFWKKSNHHEMVSAMAGI